MEKIIISFLEKNYDFSLSTLSSYKLKNKNNGQDIYLTELFSLIEDVFDINRDELMKIWDKWADKKVILINNRITEIRYKLYELNGSDFVITPDILNEHLDKY